MDKKSIYDTDEFIELVASSALLHVSLNLNLDELSKHIASNLDKLNKRLDNDDKISSAEYDNILNLCTSISLKIKQILKDNKHLIDVIPPTT